MNKPRLINRFEGGINESSRDSSQRSFNTSTYVENFEVRSEIGILYPKPSILQDQGSYQNTDVVTKFAVAGSIIYGLGNTVLNQLTGAFTGSPSWTTLVNGFAAGSPPATMEAGLLVYQGYLYWMYSNRFVARYNIISTVFTTAYADLGANNTITGSLFIGKDDNIYVPYLDTNGIPSIAKLVGTAFTTPITFPQTYTAIQLEKYGNYLAIACPNKTISSESVVFLWDYVSDDVTEIIPCGQAVLLGFGNTGDSLILVSKTASLITAPKKQQLIFQSYSGGTPSVIKRFTPEASSFPIVDINLTANTGHSRPRVVNNSIYFGVQYTFDIGSSGTTYRYGVMKLGKLDASYPMALTIDARSGNETGVIGDALYAGDYILYSTVTDATHSSVFTHLASGWGTSTFQSLIQSGSSVQDEKQDQYVSVSTLPLISGAQIDLYARSDGDTSFTPVFTENTLGSLYRKSNIYASGDSLPKYYENMYQIVSTGGAQVTGIEYQTDEYASAIK